MDKKILPWSQGIIFVIASAITIFSLNAIINYFSDANIPIFREGHLDLFAGNLIGYSVARGKIKTYFKQNPTP